MVISFQAPQLETDSAPSLAGCGKDDRKFSASWFRNPLQSAFTTQHRQSLFFILGRMACTSAMLLGCGQILLEEIAVVGSLAASLEDEGDLE